MDAIIAWLLDGDVSIQYQVRRDLLCADEPVLNALRERIADEGFGARLLSLQQPSGHWGSYYYQPKWTCTHYTLLDLKNLGLPPSNAQCRAVVERFLETCQMADGSIRLSRRLPLADVAVDGMILNYAAYFCPENARLQALAMRLMAAQHADGGFNWDPKAREGEPHSTICILEGLAQYRASLPDAAARALDTTLERGLDFYRARRFFVDAEDARFCKLSYPYRYRCDRLRALELCARVGLPFEPALQPLLEWLADKRGRDGRWRLEHIHKGNQHFLMERAGEPSRFITLKALRILQAY